MAMSFEQYAGKLQHAQAEAEKQVEADSQSLTHRLSSIGRMGIYTLYPVLGVSDKWQQSLEN